MSNIHIGFELHKAAKHHKLSVTEIAKRSGYGQSMFYKHVKNPNLPFSILKKYADTLNYYFNNEIPEFIVYLKKNGLLKDSENELSLKELLDKVEYWKDQAFDLTKRNNELLQQLIDKQKESDLLKGELAELKREIGNNNG